MPISVIALLCFLTILIGWVVMVKRSLAEGMIIGFAVVCLFAGTGAVEVAWAGASSALSSPIVYAAVTFVFMAYLVDQLGIMRRIIDVMNSLLGRVRGGPAYVETVASAAMGALAGSTSGNAAATGSVTAPWMVRQGFSKERAATIVAGNSAMGTALPPGSSMIIMLGFASGMVTTGSVYVALFVSGLYQIAHRFILAFYFIRKDNIARIPQQDLLSLGESWKRGWTSTLVYTGALIPIALTVGPIAAFFENNPGVGDSLSSVQIMLWIPTLIVAFSLIVGWRSLPRQRSEMFELVNGCIGRLSEIGIMLFFALAAAQVFTVLDLGGDIDAYMQHIHLPQWAMVVIVTLVMAAICGPLAGGPGVAVLGQVSLLTLVAAGVDPVIAVVVILMASSTEGQTPPAAVPAFIAAALVDTKPQKLFAPLMTYYLVPVLILTILVGVGILPVPILN